MAADFEEAGDGDVLRKVGEGPRGQGYQAVAGAEIRAKMDELVTVAVAQVTAGK